MVRGLHVNLAQTSNSELLAIARSSGFDIVHGAKHDKVKTSDGKFITLIPRHETVYKPLAKEIVKAMVAFGATITFS